MSDGKKRIGYAFCGSFCTLSRSINVMRTISGLGYELVPIVSGSVISTDTRFGTAEHFISEIEGIAERPVIYDIAGAEPLGPKMPLDMLIIAPCTGNTLAKIANGITDTSVTMAAKAHLRADRPLLIALATNDGMSQNLGNIGRVLTRKGVYFVPMLQDDPKGKPHSLVADFEKIPECLCGAFTGVQTRPLFK